MLKGAKHTIWLATLAGLTPTVLMKYVLKCNRPDQHQGLPIPLNPQDPVSPPCSGGCLPNTIKNVRREWLNQINSQMSPGHIIKWVYPTGKNK